VAALKAEKKRLAEDTKRVAKEEKKEKQKRQRLMHKAGSLTDHDLLSIVANRAQGRAKAKAKGKG
jgi:hypothetical protein